ncbi:unnamed protein product [Owenia fusiformis]|uniref:Uncharacterized protein n=1 Tax=Owenia fusiformis TaxID=6347 RepID=A0A8J1TKJ0_OWEFU|nr:unnamed protein product [Owenia fusiformis]
MDRWKGRIALVTGGSMGIGAATVTALATRGMKVVTCARSFDKLKLLAYDLNGKGFEVHPIQCDLRQEDEISAMFKEIKEKYGGVDVLVNSAGLALNANIIDGDKDKWKNMFEVNVYGLMSITQGAVKSMRERNVDDGQIINMNSLSGHRVGKMHVYSATKYAVDAITESIRWELRDINSHIRVMQISPGMVKSHFHATMLGSEKKAEKKYANSQHLESDDIADIIVYSLSTPPHVQIHDVLVRPTEQVP